MTLSINSHWSFWLAGSTRWSSIASSKPLCDDGSNCATLIKVWAEGIGGPEDHWKIGKLVYNKLSVVSERAPPGYSKEIGVWDWITKVFESLKKYYPEFNFFGEESGTDGIEKSDSYWLLDPLDGTRNFIHQYLLSFLITSTLWTILS